MKKFKVSQTFYDAWIAFVAIIAILAIILVMSSCSSPSSRRQAAIDKQASKRQGVIIRTLSNDTIKTKKGHKDLIWYYYIVKEDKYPELQLIKRTEGFHVIGDTLIYFRND